jgi:hypothetical protein
MKYGQLARMDTGLVDAILVCVRALTDTNVRALLGQLDARIRAVETFPNVWREGLGKAWREWILRLRGG